MGPAAPWITRDGEEPHWIFAGLSPPEPQPPMPPPREARRRSLFDVFRGGARAEKSERTRDDATPAPTSELDPGQPNYDRSQFDSSEPHRFEPEPPQDRMFEPQGRRE